jgi:replicative DNA helicase
MSNKNFDELEEEKIETGIVKPNPITDDLEKYFKTLGDGTKTMLGIETGLAPLDNATLGLDGVIVLGGIAGKGKTSLALQLAFDACEKGTPIIFYSLEMPKRAIYTRLLSRLSKIKFSDILLKGKLFLGETGQDTLAGFAPTDKNKQDFSNAIAQLKKVSDKFYIRSREREEADIDFEKVEEEINIIKGTHNAEKVLVVIDHLQVFSVEGSDQIDRENKLINGFKGISERTGATTLLISQKNKAGIQSKGLHTIKGSVDIIYLADVVMELWSEEEKDTPEIEIAQNILGGDKLTPIDLIISKNRYNAPTKITLDFSGAFSNFSERDRQ